MTIFETTEAELKAQGFDFERVDFNRPWGGFFVIDENQANQFTAAYFSGMNNADLIEGRKVSPKILLVAPKKRLSWQYHHRRSEVWRVIEGEVGIVRSETDEQGELETFKVGDVIILKKGERHRLVGLSDWGKVAEIWQHTDPNYPSDEDDIVRLQDDFGRS
jgi:mannose-6-phosphate isomerase-like protein (cupin superfamily)